MQLYITNRKKYIYILTQISLEKRLLIFRDISQAQTTELHLLGTAPVTVATTDLLHNLHG